VEPENNFTSEIEEVVSEQRQLIAEEMLGYPYPAGRYNISARFVCTRFPPRLIFKKKVAKLWWFISITSTSEVIKFI
jgi:hypothetical protein